MKSRHNTSVVDLVSQLGPNASGYSLYVYGCWTERQLVKRLIAAVEEGTLSQMIVGEKRFFTAVADQLEPEQLRELMEAVKNKKGYPRLSDEQLYGLLQVGLSKGYLDEEDGQLIVTPAGSKYLRSKEALTLVK